MIVKRFDFSKKPIGPLRPLTFLARKFVCKADLKKRGFICNRINMEGVKPPFILLSTHASMVDFEIAYSVTDPFKIRNVATIETFHDYPALLIRYLGVVAKRKFTNDYYLIKHIKSSLESGHIFCIYPEARYSLDGTTSYLPQSLGKMLKMFKVPVVTLNIRGDFVDNPHWNGHPKGNRVEADYKLLFKPQDLERLSVDEINEQVKKDFCYDDLAWQKRVGLKIDHPQRADGLHQLLYQCPNCKTQFKMNSAGSELWCEHCNKRWEMTELGELKAQDGNTEFTHIPDWSKWERQNVREEVRSGNYKMQFEGRLETLPKYKFYKQGKVKFVQDSNGITIEGNAYGQPFTLRKTPLEQECVHIEYNYLKQGNCVDISTNDDSYYVYPENVRDVVTKISFATEELYAFEREKKNLKVDK